MNKAIILSALAASLLASFAVHAADTTELKVKGTVRPNACTPTLTADGVIDYGTIPAASLKAGNKTTLAEKAINLAIVCDNAAKIAVTFTDNRAATRVPGIVSAGESANFGLGSAAGNNIGGYSVKFDTVTKDGGFAIYLGSNDSGASWATYSPYADTVGGYVSVGTGSATPAAGKVFSMGLKVQAVLNKPENMSLTQDVPLDGSATIEVRYL